MLGSNTEWSQASVVSWEKHNHFRQTGLRGEEEFKKCSGGGDRKRTSVTVGALWGAERADREDREKEFYLISSFSAGG